MLTDLISVFYSIWHSAMLFLPYSNNDSCLQETWADAQAALYMLVTCLGIHGNMRLKICFERFQLITYCSWRLILTLLLKPLEIWTRDILIFGTVWANRGHWSKNASSTTGLLFYWGKCDSTYFLYVEGEKTFWMTTHLDVQDHSITYQCFIDLLSVWGS